MWATLYWILKSNQKSNFHRKLRWLRSTFMKFNCLCQHWITCTMNISPQKITNCTEFCGDQLLHRFSEQTSTINRRTVKKFHTVWLNAFIWSMLSFRKEIFGLKFVWERTLLSGRWIRDVNLIFDDWTNRFMWFHLKFELIKTFFKKNFEKMELFWLISFNFMVFGGF